MRYPPVTLVPVSDGPLASIDPVVVYFWRGWLAATGRRARSDAALAAFIADAESMVGDALIDGIGEDHLDEDLDPAVAGWTTAETSTEGGVA